MNACWLIVNSLVINNLFNIVVLFLIEFKSVSGMLKSL